MWHEHPHETVIIRSVWGRVLLFVPGARRGVLLQLTGRARLWTEGGASIPQCDMESVGRPDDRSLYRAFLDENSPSADGPASPTGPWSKS